jgi:hypothetical protein
VGYTEGALDGTTNAGSFDVYVLRFDASGALQSSSAWGTTAGDYAYAAAPGPDGSVFVVGQTEGALVDASFGYADGFVRRIAP